jgi:hypothetical protein
MANLSEHDFGVLQIAPERAEPSKEVALITSSLSS